MAQVIKKMLATTLKELMQTQSLSKITISDLTQTCGVSRQTFYNNFHDLYELVEWIYLNDVQVAVGETASYDNWQSILASLFQYLADHKKFVEHTYHSVSKLYLEQFLNREVERFLTELIVSEITVSGKEAEQVEFSIAFYTYALVGVGLDWIEHGMMTTPQELVQKIENVMIGTIVARIS